MGTRISRIEKEFVLGAVADKQMQVHITGNKREADGSLLQIDDELLSIGLEEEAAEAFTPGSPIVIYFSYFGHVMTFNTTVRSHEHGTIRVETPEALYKNLMRKYARVRGPDGSSVSFTVRETRIELGFPKTEEYDPVELPKLAEEFDPRNIETLIVGFREKTRRKASINTVVMFRDRQPRGFEETIVSRTGKILFIPSTSGRFPENDYQIGGRIITRAMLLTQDAGSGETRSAQDRLPSLLAEKRERGIRAEMYCPILFHEYVVGYVYLAQDRDMEASFDHDLLDFVYQFAKVIAYSLKINGYFKEEIPEAGQYEGALIDISAAGLLFSNPSAKLANLLSLYTDIDLVLKFGDRKIRIVGRVMRKYQSEELNFFGLQFMEMKPEDFRFLFEFVYGRAVTAEDEELWEGGAEPPELEL